MKLPLPLGLALVFVVQAALAGLAVVDRERALDSGTEVRLAVEPIDPRDLLRGDYIVLTYAISRLPVADDRDFATGDTIYVALSPDGDGWTASPPVAAPPASGVVLRGTVRAIQRPFVNCETDCGPHVIVDYGIDRFFVPEGEGRTLERLRNDQRLAVDIAVAPDGAAMVKRLLVDGEPLYEVSMFR